LSGSGDYGPLLVELVTNQIRAEEAVANSSLRDYARAVIRVSDEDPLIWPIGNEAQRLVGAAQVVSDAELRVAGETHRLEGEKILLVVAFAVSPLPLWAAAEHATLLGAREVHACGIHVAGLPDADTTSLVATYRQLTAG
jgi:hypothetical protein